MHKRIKQVLSLALSAALPATAPGMGGLYAWADGGKGSRIIEIKAGSRIAAGRQQNIPDSALSKPSLLPAGLSADINPSSHEGIPLELPGLQTELNLPVGLDSVSLAQAGAASSVLSQTAARAAHASSARQAIAARAFRWVQSVTGQVRSVLTRKTSSPDPGRVIMDGAEAGGRHDAAAVPANPESSGFSTSRSFLSRFARPGLRGQAGAVPAARVSPLAGGTSYFRTKYAAAVAALMPVAALAAGPDVQDWFARRHLAWWVAAPLVVAALAAIFITRAPPVKRFLDKIQVSWELWQNKRGLGRFFDSLTRREQVVHVVVSGMSLDEDALRGIYGAPFYETRTTALALLGALNGNKVAFAVPDPFERESLEAFLLPLHSRNDPAVKNALKDPALGPDQKRDIALRTRESVMNLVHFMAPGQPASDGKNAGTPDTPVSLTQKVLNDPAWIAEFKRLKGAGNGAMFVYVTSGLETALRKLLGIPLFSPHLSLAELGDKRGNKELFEAAKSQWLGTEEQSRILIPAWRDGGRSPESLAMAIRDLFNARGAKGNPVEAVMVKGLTGTSGGCNAELRKPRGFDGATPEQQYGLVLGALPSMKFKGRGMDWPKFEHIMQSQSVIAEEFIDDFGGPGTHILSGQGKVIVEGGGRIARVLSNHTQIVSQHGIYQGLMQPADVPIEVRALLHKSTQAIGNELARRAYDGWFAIDYYYDRDGYLWWNEGNLRVGGPTQALTAADALFGAQYNESTYSIQVPDPSDPKRSLDLDYVILDHIMLEHLDPQAWTLGGRPLKPVTRNGGAKTAVLPWDMIARRFWRENAPAAHLMLKPFGLPGDPEPEGFYPHLTEAAAALGNWAGVYFKINAQDNEHVKGMQEIQRHLGEMEDERLTEGANNRFVQRLRIDVPELDGRVHLVEELYKEIARGLHESNFTFQKGERVVAISPARASEGVLSFKIAAYPQKARRLCRLIELWTEDFLQRHGRPVPKPEARASLTQEPEKLIPAGPRR